MGLGSGGAGRLLCQQLRLYKESFLAHATGTRKTARAIFAHGGWEYQARNEGQTKGGDPITRDWESNTHYV
jgi:hypothetical protein